MTASAYEDGPIRPVFSPADVEDVREHLDRQRSLMARLLVARDAVLDAMRSGAGRLVELAERYRLGWAVLAARRALGWLSGAAGAAGRGLRTPGLGPALVWAAFTDVGQSVLRSGINRAGQASSATAHLALKCTTAGLRIFGMRGDMVASWLEAKAGQVHRKARATVKAVSGFAGELFLPSGLLAQGVASLAKAKALNALLGRLLPGRWSGLGRVVAMLVTLPGWARRELVRMVTSRWNAQPVMSAVPASEDDPRPPAPPVALPVPFQQEETDVPRAVNNSHPSLTRYPAAKRSSNAKKRR